MKIRSILGCWKFRRLSLLGKIAVLKSLVASQLVYILSPLQTNHQAIKEIRITEPGEYCYMSTRNNNFSNRRHMGQITVSEP